jgi:hypothetical protein
MWIPGATSLQKGNGVQKEVPSGYNTSVRAVRERCMEIWLLS